MVGEDCMERLIFIHGSASGQSSLPRNQESSQLCNEISKWYFEGRESRVIGTSVPRPMFVEIYKSTDGNRYCLYSFVLNECYGPAPDYRAGQYFALTIALRGYYCLHPSSIYNILSKAYDHVNAWIIADKVVVNGKEYHNVYKIHQFRDKAKELIDFQNKIANFFDQDCLQLCKPLPDSVKLPLPWNGKEMIKMVNNRAECLSWNGETINLTECDSGASTDKLMNEGRIYVSDKALLSSAIVQKLREENEKLLRENNALQKKVDSPAPNPEDQKMIASLNQKVKNLEEQVSQANDKKEQLQSENQEYEKTFKVLSETFTRHKESTTKQLNKINENISNERGKSKDWKRFGLLSINVLILICLFLNFCFFLNISSNIDKICSQIDLIMDNFEKKLPDDPVPESNKTSTESQSEEGSVEQSISGDQKKSLNWTTTATISSRPNYGLTITDENGNPLKKVYYGQTIKATVTKPVTGLNFTLDGVASVNSNPPNSILLKVSQQTGNITIGYGPSGKENRSKREIKSLPIEKQ